MLFFNNFLLNHLHKFLSILNKAVFLDRDGVLNVDRPDYVYKSAQFKLIPGVREGLRSLKDAGYKLIVITNQSGIAKKIYEHSHVKDIHDILQQQCNNLIDAFYYAPWHPNISESLTRKPGTLLFERAIAKFKINPLESWMIGDRNRDLIPAKKIGMHTILLGDALTESADMVVENLKEASEKILVA
jgi:D-glycero-D-manno-heptose 1,7-bisphosphate phosphatase